MKKKCKYCNEEFELTKDKIGRLITKQIFCSRNCSNNWQYNNNEEYRERVIRNTRAWEKENPEKTTEKRKKSLKKFRERTPERFNKLMMNDYNRNKLKWNERKFTFHHRKKLLELLPKKCFQCGINKVKHIHHIEYGKQPKLIKGRGAKEKNRKYLIKFCENLNVFCSKQCHTNHEKEVKKVEIK